MDAEIQNNPSIDVKDESAANPIKIVTEKPEPSDHLEKNSSDNSQYDSAGSYTDEEDEENADDEKQVRSRGSSRSETESEDDVILEREEGDGQESVPQKKVDDDEDKKNPQYIPKRGTFYEHDDRTAEDAENEEVSESVEKPDKDQGKKKVWQDKKEKWSHDRFNDTEQAPKSRAELIAIYGYDIRNEEGPPRARRRRRYGRGPNKYTRNWEDEDAYNKPAPKPRPKKQHGQQGPRKQRPSEDFPSLSGGGGENDGISNQRHRSPESTRNRDRDRDIYNDRESNGNAPVSSTSRGSPNDNGHNSSYPQYAQPPPQNQRNSEPTVINKGNQQLQQQQRIGSGRVIKNREIKDSDYRGFTAKTRQVKSVRNTQQKVMSANIASTNTSRTNQKRDDFIHSQNFTNKSNSLQDVENDMSKLSVHDGGGGYKGGKHGNSNGGGQRQGSMPPRLQSEQKGSKRYSSMRQRSLPEAATPPSYPPSYYSNEYNQQAGAPPAAQTTQQSLLHQNPTQIHPNSTQTLPQTGLPPLPQQVPVTAAPLLQPQFAPTPFPPQAPPPFLRPGVAAPPFIPSQQPQILNYVQSQPAFTPNYQGFQQQFNPVSQPTELYQPQGGITYYSTDQQVAQRSVPQKRPKAAIPIVAPPDDSKQKSKKDEEIVQDNATAATVINKTDSTTSNNQNVEVDAPSSVAAQQ